METMTKLEREQALKLLELDDTIDAMFSRENEHQGIIQQIRDELAKCKAELKDVSDTYADCGRLLNDQAERTKQLAKRAECAESELRESKSKVLAMCTEVNGNLLKERDELKAELEATSDCADSERQERKQLQRERDDYREQVKQLTKERDEALAKVKQLEQPRMFMRDGEQLWEVFRIFTGVIGEASWEFYNVIGDNWKACGDDWAWRCDRLYRRPITADELRSWLPQQQSDAKPVESNTDTIHKAMQNAATYYNSINGQFNGACFSRALMELAGLGGNIDGKLVSAIMSGRSDVECLYGGSHYRIKKPQQPDELLFEGVRWIHKNWEQPMREGSLDVRYFDRKDESAGITVRVHFEIRKAGE